MNSSSPLRRKLLRRSRAVMVFDKELVYRGGTTWKSVRPIPGPYRRHQEIDQDSRPLLTLSLLPDPVTGTARGADVSTDDVSTSYCVIRGAGTWEPSLSGPRDHPEDTAEISRPRGGEASPRCRCVPQRKRERAAMRSIGEKEKKLMRTNCFDGPHRIYCEGPIDDWATAETGIDCLQVHPPVAVHPDMFPSPVVLLRPVDRSHFPIHPPVPLRLGLLHHLHVKRHHSVAYEESVTSISVFIPSPCFGTEPNRRGAAVRPCSFLGCGRSRMPRKRRRPSLLHADAEYNLEMSSACLARTTSPLEPPSLSPTCWHVNCLSTPFVAIDQMLIHSLVVHASPIWSSFVMFLAFVHFDPVSFSRYPLLRERIQPESNHRGSTRPPERDSLTPLSAAPTSIDPSLLSQTLARKRCINLE
ncbi:hypothetical protein B296_00003005 [Ensete ventricosum]|uniref:Uncharacterized protein n=1 Tax=Ensete ventricosum TaxID=4639 RepID=A0A427AY35_ENSVE|nr:hypothetical protein B296_00003005 [Ensete ventricosum]